MLKLNDYDFNLPDELIAKYPKSVRSSSRLLKLNRQSGELSHHVFSDIYDFLQPNDLLVLNNTKVFPARLFGQKDSGGRIEILIERILSKTEVLAHIRASKAPKKEAILHFDKGIKAKVIEKKDPLTHLQFMDNIDVLEICHHIGKIPLPPYMQREEENDDKSRYQTVFAEFEGSVAAPTAGFHFDEMLLQKIKAKDVQIEYVTLHIGAGTFQPVRVEEIVNHKMHHEYCTITQNLCDAILQTRQKGGRVIAVGTTSVRSLETAAIQGLKPYEGETNLFIYPGFQFQVVDAMVTNFHLPKSSLLMLVSAFAGFEPIKKAYQEAIHEQYRFYSYGDAMFIA